MLSDKESACNGGEVGLIPELGRFPGGGNGNPPQYSCLGNPMDRGTWWATVVYKVYDLATKQQKCPVKLGRNHTVKCLTLIVSLLGHKCVSSHRKQRYRNLGISCWCIRNHGVWSLQEQQVTCPFPRGLC